MTTYKGIKGFSIQNLSADPSNPIEGQVWYNSTSNVWKVEEVTAAGAWASGNPLSVARVSLAGAGTQTAALAFGGVDTANTGATEEYDGATWTSSNSLNTARRYIAGCGTQTAGLAFGGYTTTPTGATEEYNGATWTSNPTGLNTARDSLGGCGTQTAGLAFGGSPDGTSVVASTEEWTGAGAAVTQTITVS